MERMCLTFGLLAYVAATVGTARAETITGVLYSIHWGHGRQPAGHVRLAVGDRVLALGYFPVEQRLLVDRCYDIGAIWTGTLLGAADGRYITAISCGGKVDKTVHAAWQAVTQYLESSAGRSRRKPSDTLSARWRASHVSNKLQPEMLDLSSYRNFGAYGRCLDVLSVEPAKSDGSLIFEVLWNQQVKRWEIDRIQMIGPEDYWNAIRGEE